MDQVSKEVIFDAVKIRKCVLYETERILKDQKYDRDLNEKLCSTIVKNVLSQIAPDGKTNFKFITHCMISPIETSGYDSYSKNYWCDDTDGMCVVNYQNSNLKFSITLWGVRS